MKRFLRFLIIPIFAVLFVLGMQNCVEAKSYSIEDMDIQATVNENGSVSIEQSISYKFNGSYNGIYITVPYNLEDSEYEEIVKDNKIDDNIYNGNKVQVNSVSLMQNGTEETFKEVANARNGSSMVYTNTQNDGFQNIKIFSPSTDESKTFKINYVIDNLCVRHNDIGELYYNFIGGAWEVEIKKLNIDVYIPQNKDQIYIWAHGPYNGISKIINNTHANFKVKNIKPGQYVATRVLFENSNIPLSTKLSNINAKDIIYNDEQSIIDNKEEKNAFTWKIVLCAVCLLIYWIILMLIYEKDKKYIVSNVDEDKLFEKYNPMLAGCIQGSRTILARDIIAIILELINKKIIKIDIKGQIEGKDNYIYVISKNEEAENEMDSMEKYVYNWVFEKGNKVNLSERLKQMPKEKEANIKFKKLNSLVEDNLSTLGANQPKVPFIIRAFNVFLFILSIVLIYKHIAFNGFNIYDSVKSNNILMHISVYMIPLIPVIIGILYLPINLIIIIRHKINKTVQRVSGQKIVTTTISLIAIFTAIIIFTAILSPIKYIIADEILICIATILILTDNLMLKNNVLMIEDYSKLNTLKNIIEDYTIIQDRDVEQIVLWEKYLSYAVSFGVATKIVKRIQGLFIDDDLMNLINNDTFKYFIMSDYYIFYNHASLDRRFMRAYARSTGKVLDSMFSISEIGSSRRKWRWLL